MLTFGALLDWWKFYRGKPPPKPPRPQPPPTATLSANPASIITGQSLTLSWSSTNATACTGVNFNGSGVSGFTVVTPAATTSYSITCSGVGGSVTATTTATVTDPPPPPPPPPPLLSLVVTPPNPIIASDHPIGEPVASLAGVWSDGKFFTGQFLFVEPNYDCAGIYMIVGDKLMINPSGPGVGDAGGSIEDVTIAAME